MVFLLAILAAVGGVVFLTSEQIMLPNYTPRLEAPSLTELLNQTPNGVGYPALIPATPTLYPVGYPPLFMATPTLTPTPDRFAIATNIARARLTNYPTATPMVISETIDASPELPDEEKYLVVVSRQDRTNVQYKIGPLILDETRTESIVYGDDPRFLKLIARLLQPGDRVYSSIPYAMWIVRPGPIRIATVPN